MDTGKFSGHAGARVITRTSPAHFEWAVKLNRFSLNLIGLWPRKGSRANEKLSSDLKLLAVFVAITGVCTTPSLHSLMKVWGDMAAVVDNMLFTLPLLMISMKMIIMWWKKETFSPLITMIARDWLRPKSSDERNIMVHRAQQARLIIVCSYAVMLSTLAVEVTVTALGYNVRYITNVTDNNGRPLPVQVYYAYDASTSPSFEFTFIAQCIVLVTVAFSYTGLDNFLGLLVFHICGQLENLTGRLYHMDKDQDFAAALRINVRDHVRLIRSVAIIEDTFTLVLLVIFLYFGITFCLFGFLFVTVICEEENVSINRAASLIMIICTTVTHMCIYCAVGELLVAKYEEVYNAIYEFKWYTLETKKAKNLIFLIARTSKPLYITAGKIFPMTMSTFCNILKTSASYISVLLANRN